MSLIKCRPKLKRCYLTLYCRKLPLSPVILNIFSGMSIFLCHLTFMDPCIIVQFINKTQQDAKMYQNFIIPYLYEAQHVSGDTPPIIRSLKQHWQPLVFHTWKVIWTYSWWTLSGTLCLMQGSTDVK